MRLRSHRPLPKPPLFLRVNKNLPGHSWIARALPMNPLHVDFTEKLADILGIMDRYEEAVAILERLERTPEAPTYLKQWLGRELIILPRRYRIVEPARELDRGGI